MDNQQKQTEADERKEAEPKSEERRFDPWEQAFSRDFQRQERDFEF
ncbi:hypothetical protein ACI2KT_18860 [Ensifer adhaerens]